VSAAIDEDEADGRMMEFHLDELLGEVVTFEEREYAYGIGKLRLRLLRVGLSRSDPGWATVVGAFVDFRGIEHDIRQVSVRVEALAAHARRVRAGER
jgi:hypothetical protein